MNFFKKLCESVLLDYFYCSYKSHFFFSIVICSFKYLKKINLKSRVTRVGCKKKIKVIMIYEFDENTLGVIISMHIIVNKTEINYFIFITV